jgi:hypothetical protein
MHSKFTSGQNDSRGNPKPFFNITKGKVNIAIRATDIDRKDISMKENGSDDYFRALCCIKIQPDAHEEDESAGSHNSLLYIVLNFGCRHYYAV